MDKSLHQEIKEAIVRSLRLPMEAQDVSDHGPLFGPGSLGLDSVDVLELVLELERSFGVTIEDQDTGMQALRNVDSIAEFIQAHRSQPPV